KPQILKVMRHGDKIKNLGRKKAHREALLSNLSCQLIEHKRIVTTLAKAKALRVYVEPLITKGRTNTTHQRRVVFSYLQDKEAVTELFSTIAEKIAGRPGGYTRIIKLGARPGDNAETAMIELVDFNEVYGKGKGEAKTAAKKTRRSGGAKKKAEVADAPEAEEKAAE
ncbi:MAG TPA: 50S ribosomal protein L17, partial [Chitinophagaceae bacterium]|nr:50S ribosomal protein L17 [Chitinophagaceae bacterium]